MSTVPVADRLQRVFRDVFDDETLEIRDETTAHDVPDWDSLAHVTLVVSVEKAFGVRFTSAEVSALKCVGDLRRLIEVKAAE
jgi:acyl carrier protein